MEATRADGGDVADEIDGSGVADESDGSGVADESDGSGVADESDGDDPTYRPETSQGSIRNGKPEDSDSNGSTGDGGSDSHSDGPSEIIEVRERFPGLISAGPSTSEIGASPDGEQLPTVASTRNGKKRVWDKRNVCLYCDKPQSTLSRHLERKHGNESAVQHALSFEKKSKGRLEAWESLRNRGNYAHNVQVKLGKKKGELIPWRRNQQGQTKHRAHDFLLCDGCKGFFFRKTLWRHMRTCSRRQGRIRSGRVQREALAQLPVDPAAPAGYNELLESMVIDDVSLICKTDVVIRQFGLRLFRKHGTERHQRQYVSCKLRELGRLVKELRRNDPSATLAAYLTASKFGEVTGAVRRICRFDEQTNKYGVPSLALKLGHSLKKCAAIQKANLIQCEGDEKQIDGFIQLVEMEWTDVIARPAHTTLYEDKWNRSDLLPIADDLIKLQEHLTCQIEVATQNLKDEPKAEHHKVLAEATLARLILFNRRRQGEVGRLKTEFFQKADKVQLQPDVEATLSPFERQLSENLKRVVVKGKKGRGVPLLLTTEVSEAITLLLDTKEKVGVKASEYVFTTTAGEPLRGCDALKKFALACGAKHPEAITSTNLRKHIATVSQVLNLKNNELDQLANFLGHDIRVHREFYRLPESCTQVTKISQLLMAAEGDCMAKHRGKSLDQLNTVRPGAGNEEVEKEQGMPMEDDEEEGLESQAIRESGKEKRTQEEPQLRGPSPKRKKRTTWSQEEKSAVWRACGDYIRRGEVPGVSVCSRAIAEEHALRDRAWRAVKYCCHNIITAERRRSK